MEAFVYKWTDNLTGKFYIGSHKGSPDDGYICSSKLMKERYNERPEDFSREIIAEGDHKNMIALEAEILDEVDARANTYYYNQTNGNENWYCKGHTAEAKEKMRIKAIENNLEKVANGTHHFVGEKGSAFQKERVANGTNPFAGELGSAMSRKNALERVDNGTNPLSGENNVKKTCPNCKKTMNLGNYVKHGHGEDCKQKSIEE